VEEGGASRASEVLDGVHGVAVARLGRRLLLRRLQQLLALHHRREVAEADAAALVRLQQVHRRARRP